MSITRIVGGTIRKTAKGNIDIRATGGDLTLHATQNNNWSAGEGIYYEDYEPSHPADSIKDGIIVTLNIFFDGTQNNKTNTDAGINYKASNHNDDSYSNEYTNVARAFDAIDSKVLFQERIYIEGIGTEDLKSDYILPDAAMGIGDRGIVAKVTKACIKAGELMGSDTYSNKKIKELKINVFGFSRGAAAARHFLHVANSPVVLRTMDRLHFYAVSPYAGFEKIFGEIKDIRVDQYDPLVKKHGYLAACLLNNGVSPGRINFNFVGLYDTVASHGGYHENDVRDLNLDAVKHAYFVFQLSAADEYRENFDLTNIKEAGIKGLEYTLPGVHSDIGGCYPDQKEERAILYYKKASLYNETWHNADEEIYKFKDIVIKEGWYENYQIEAGKFSASYVDPEKKKPKNEDWEEKYYAVIGTRNLRNTYDKIPLKKMIEYSKQFGVVYDENVIEKLLELKGSFLQKVNDQLQNYMVACNNLRNSFLREKPNDAEAYRKALNNISYKDYISTKDLKRLRNEYLHWSVKANQIGLGSRASEAPSKEGALEEQYRKRQIHNG